MPRPRRNIRKPTRWTPDEWARVEAAARSRGVPPLRYVREAALGAPPAPRHRTRDAFVLQLGRVLNNLLQLQRAAEDDWADEAAVRIEATARAAEAAIRTAPPPGAAGAAAVQRIIAAGCTLNELAYRANADEELPPDAELIPALEAVEASFAWVFG
jgi:mobilization protein NikA